MFHLLSFFAMCPAKSLFIWVTRSIMQVILVVSYIFICLLVLQGNTHHRSFHSFVYCSWLVCYVFCKGLCLSAICHRWQCALVKLFLFLRIRENLPNATQVKRLLRSISVSPISFPSCISYLRYIYFLTLSECCLPL